MRLTVMSSTRRVDLVLPEALPVAELVPELARSVGLLDAMTSYAGHRLITRDGRVLSADTGLRTQGVVDGDVLTVVAGVDDQPPRVYDDIVEVMADAVRRDLDPWDPAAGRHAALWAGVALLAVAAGALVVQHRSALAGGAGVVVSVMLVLGAVAVSRVQGETDAAVAMALVGSGYAATAGLLLAGGAASIATRLAAGGAGALAAGSVAALGVGRGRSLLLPPVVTGGVFLGTGLLLRALSCDPAAGLTTALALVVIAGGLVPSLALMATPTGVDSVLAPSGVTDRDPEPIDPEPIAADALVAHEILVGLSAAVGVLLLLVAPVAVSLGPAGTLVAVLGCAIVMLRTRHHLARAEVLVGLVSGVLGLVATALSVLWMHPAWRPAATAVIVVTGSAFLARSRLPARSWVRRGRLGDVAESTALLALAPALVTASGVLLRIRG